MNGLLLTPTVFVAVYLVILFLPKIIPLTHLIEEFEAGLQVYFEDSFESVRNQALEILNRKISRYESCMQGVIEHGMRVIAQNDFIIQWS